MNVSVPQQSSNGRLLPSASRGAYRPELDGLRALAIVPVVLFHSEIAAFDGGYIGVDVFFVVSGFLITGILSRALSDGSFSLKSFYERRARRILPALLVVLIATILVGLLILLPRELSELGKATAATALFLSNVFLFYNTGYFAQDAATSPLLHTWSLGVEEQFYLCYPLFLLFLHRRGISLLHGILAAGAASLALSAVTVITSPSATFYFMPTRLWELLIGGAIVLAPEWNSQWSSRLREIAAAAGILLILAAALLYDVTTPFPGPSALVPCAGAALVIWASHGTKVGALLASPPLRFVGLISYSLYLWHWPVLVYARLLSGGNLNQPEAALCIVLILLLSIWSWRFVEEPYRGRAGRSPKTLHKAAAAIAVVCGVGLAVSPGLASRLSPRATQLSEVPTVPRALEVQGCFFWPDSKSTSVDKCLSAGGPGPLMVAWGDSHALLIAPAVARSVPIEFRLLGRASCAPFVAMVAARRGTVDRECGKFNSSAFRAIVSNPNVKVVLLAGRWARFTFPIRDDDARSLVSPGDTSMSPGENALLAEVASTVAALQRAGKVVVLMGVVPEFEQPLPSCLARASQFGRAEHLCRYRDQTLPSSLFSSQFSAAAAKATNALVIKPSDSLCPDGACRRLINGTPVTFDRNHLTPEAVSFVIGDPRAQHVLRAAVEQATSGSPRQPGR